MKEPKFCCLMITMIDTISCIIIFLRSINAFWNFYTMPLSRTLTSSNLTFTVRSFFILIYCCSLLKLMVYCPQLGAEGRCPGFENTGSDVTTLLGALNGVNSLEGFLGSLGVPKIRSILPFPWNLLKTHVNNWNCISLVRKIKQPYICNCC